MNDPTTSSRENPASTTIRDILVRGWIEPGSAPPLWTFDIGGTHYRGPAVDAGKHNSMIGFREMLQQWAKEHAQLFA